MSQRITLVLWMALLNIANAQTGVLTVANYPYYFRTSSNEIRDARDFKLVASGFPQGEVRFSPDKKNLLVLTNGYSGEALACLQLDGKQIANTPIPRGAVISKEWDRILMVKNKDLWLAGINYKTGQLINEKQITQLGIFWNVSNALISWHKNVVALNLHPQYIRVDLDTKAVDELFTSNEPNYAYLPGSPSPDGRYLLHTGVNYKTKATVNDLIINKITATEVPVWQQTQVWLNENQFISTISPDLFSGEHKEGWMIYDVSALNQVKVIQHSELLSPGLKEKQFAQTGKRSACVSPGGECFWTYSGVSGDLDIKIVNVKENRIIDPQVKATPVKSWEWVSDQIFAYAQGGSVVKQGTYLYNVGTGVNQKITSYIADAFVVLKDAGYIVFTANGAIYRVNMDGTDVKQLSTQPINTQIKIFMQP